MNNDSMQRCVWAYHRGYLKIISVNYKEVGDSNLSML